MYQNHAKFYQSRTITINNPLNMNIEQSIQYVVEKAFQKQFDAFRERLLEDIKPNKLLTINEVAKILRVSPRTVQNKIHSNNIKASFNGKWLIQQSEIDNYLKLKK